MLTYRRPIVSLWRQLLTRDCDPEEEEPTHLVVLETVQLVILATPLTAVLSVWDIATKQCLHSVKAHVQVGDIPTSLTTLLTFKVVQLVH